MRNLLLLTAFLFGSLQADEVAVRSPEGELIVLDVRSHDQFLAVLEGLHSQFGHKSEVLLDFMVASTPHASALGVPVERNYYKGITQDQIDKITFITNTLGFGSLIDLARNRGKLKDFGKDLEPVHPFWFVSTIFTDEKMKAAVHAMQSRGWIWDEFYAGIRDSLDEESAKNNITPEMIREFSARVGVDPQLITPALERKQWKQFVNLLIENIPRKGDTKRYDM